MISGPIYFLDTSYWVALLLVRDQYHNRALAWLSYLRGIPCRYTTTQPVLWELLNFLAAPAHRAMAAQVVRRCQADTTVEVVGLEPELEAAALRLYESRPDKAWGVIDCLSFEIMARRSVVHALTADHHFEQAGFEAVLLREPPST